MSESHCCQCASVLSSQKLKNMKLEIEMQLNLRIYICLAQLIKM